MSESTTPGPVAIITGAGSGIGRAVARSLHQAGYRLALTGRRNAPLDALAVELGADAARVLTVTADVTDSHGINAAIAAVVSHFGRIDLLFNNAGSFDGAASFAEIAETDWRNIVDVNLTGAFLTAQAVYRQMQAQSPRGGRIINNGSISAQVPRPNAAGYTATKHAITGLTKAIALEGRAQDIACGQIDIGNASTNMTAGLTAGALQPDGSLLEEPLIDVGHIAAAVVYMASLPLGANVPQMTVMANGMPFVGRG